VGTATTDVDGVACFDGLAVGTTYWLFETVPSGYEIVGDNPKSVTTGATHAECPGTGTLTEITVENTPLTDIDITVTAQVSDATRSTIECKDADGNVVGSATLSDPASVDIDDLPPGTYTCVIVIDP
jgi:uncharacterized surface anchored protein